MGFSIIMSRLKAFMKILAIETSCDETAAAVVEDGWNALSNVIASSLALHQKTGGVVPEVAARAQIESIIPVLQEALDQAFPGKAIEEQAKMIDAIAVTTEPGLVTSLLVGTETGKWLAWLWEKPLIKVNHIHGHVYANWLDRDSAEDPILFPVVSLSVSGGHNDLILIKEAGYFEILGQTQDDAAGEAFDKVARVLGLGYPGGPAIERLALSLRASHSEAKQSRMTQQTAEIYEIASSSTSSPSRNDIQFPRAWLNKNRHLKTWDETNFNFSFSGLKSEVIREVQRRGDLKEQDRIEIAYSFQEAVFDVLATKLLGAAKKFHAKEIHLAGGVSANKRFREVIEKRLSSSPSPAKERGQGGEVCLRTPTKMIYCTDNAAMIGAAAFFENSNS